MAEKLDLKDVSNSKECMMSYVFKREALINLLKEKGIIFREMSWEEIKGLLGKHTSSARPLQFIQNLNVFLKFLVSGHRYCCRADKRMV